MKLTPALITAVKLVFAQRNLSAGKTAAAQFSVALAAHDRKHRRKALLIRNRIAKLRSELYSEISMLKDSLGYELDHEGNLNHTSTLRRNLSVAQASLSEEHYLGRLVSADPKEANKILKELGIQWQ